MKVALASTSALKVEACKRAFAHRSDVEVIPVKAESAVPEQPMNEETLTGAFNRIKGARIIVPDADLYVSIENGIFKEDGEFVDKAIVAMTTWDKDPPFVFFKSSDGVVFPAECVEEARSRGFDKWTAGQIMQERGIVKAHDNPHIDLSGKSRVAYIDDALKFAVAVFSL